MLDGTAWFGFIAASLVVLLIPGPGVLYVVARSASQGIGAGLISALGLSFGVLAHVVAAGVGLSALLLTSATAFAVVKYLGAGYLIYLGFRMLLARPAVGEVRHVEPLPWSRLFWDGVIVSALNPKIAVFFMAFLPQFIDPALGSAPGQVVLLGLVYAGLAFLTDGTYGVLAGSLRNVVDGGVSRRRAPQYVGGGLLIGLGVKTAMADR